MGHPNPPYITSRAIPRRIEPSRMRRHATIAAIAAANIIVLNATPLHSTCVCASGSDALVSTVITRGFHFANRAPRRLARSGSLVTNINRGHPAPEKNWRSTTTASRCDPSRLPALKYPRSSNSHATRSVPTPSPHSMRVFFGSFGSAVTCGQRAITSSR